MKLTKEQMDALAPYEKHFDTAVNHQWTRFPGGAALDMIHDIYRKVTGVNLPLNKCCSHCILELMTEMGILYFKSKYESGEEVNLHPAAIPDDHKEVSVSTEITGDVVVKKEVKTRKSRKAKS